MGDLRKTIDKQRDLFAKIFADRLEVDQGVFHDVMKQARRNAGLVEPHPREDICNLQRVYKIRFSRRAFLPAVMKRRKQVGSPDQIDIRIRPVRGYFIYDVFNADHTFGPLLILHSTASRLPRFPDLLENLLGSFLSWMLERLNS